MNSDLAALIDMQKAMERYDDLEGRARELPKKITVSKEGHEKIGSEHEEVVARHKQLQVDLHDAEVDLKSGEEQLAKRQNKLHDVKTNEEYTACLHEIEIQKKKNSEAETRILELMDQIEEHKEEVARSEHSVAEDKKEYAGRLKGLEEELAVVQQELESWRARVDEKRAAFKKPLLERFDRIYARNDGMALAPCNSGSCGYCQVRLAPHRIQGALEAREIITCDHCGSILYWQDETEQVSAK